MGVSAVVPSALIGAATGLRSSSGMAALAVGAPVERLSPFLRRTEVRVTNVALAAAELVADKHPKTPKRTGPPGLIARLVLGGAPRPHRGS